jgi:DNA-binding NarL/FixJ family response regulator
VLTLYDEYQAQALAAGADLFLIKGGPPESFLDAISTA